MVEGEGVGVAMVIVGISLWVRLDWSVSCGGDMVELPLLGHGGCG